MGGASVPPDFLLYMCLLKAIEVFTPENENVSEKTRHHLKVRVVILDFGFVLPYVNTNWTECSS